MAYFSEEFMNQLTEQINQNVTREDQGAYLLGALDHGVTINHAGTTSELSKLLAAAIWSIAYLDGNVTPDSVLNQIRKELQNMQDRNLKAEFKDGLDVNMGSNVGFRAVADDELSDRLKNKAEIVSSKLLSKIKSIFGINEIMETADTYIREDDKRTLFLDYEGITYSYNPEKRGTLVVYLDEGVCDIELGDDEILYLATTLLLKDLYGEN